MSSRSGLNVHPHALSVAIALLYACMNSGVPGAASVSMRGVGYPSIIVDAFPAFRPDFLEPFKPNLHLATTPAMLDPLSRVGRASLMSATSIALRPQRGVPVIGSGMMPRRTQSQSRTANRSRSIRPLGA